MIDFPELTSQHVDGARLFATRHDLVASLPIPQAAHIAEVGVALGEFSKFLVNCFKPKQLHAFDIFKLHEDATLWGRPTSEVLQGKAHVDFYRDRMGGDPVVIYEGASSETLKSLPANCLDLAYIDGAHDYAGVAADARECARALKPSGILVFNDYILYDPFIHSEYGVVPVVNELVANGGWRVSSFALQKHLFCDIALVRSSA